MFSPLMIRSGLAGLVGKMFGGQRDLYKVFGYSRQITYQEAIQRYRRQDIAARVIDAPADALWSNPPKLISDNSAWNKIWDDLVTSKNLWDAVARVDRLSGMTNYAVLLIGFDDSAKLNKPVLTDSTRKVLYLQPYSSESAPIKQLVIDPKDERYLKPETYQINYNTGQTDRNTGFFGATNNTLTPILAHYSRILHVAENYLENDIYGNPRMERVWNLLDDILKVAGGTSETFWLTANRGIQVDVDKEMELNADDEADLNAEVEEYVNQLRRVLRTRGVTVTPLGSDVPDPKNIFEMLMSLLSAGTGIPKRILIGSEAGQLASEQDRNNWAERIKERRQKFGVPGMILPLVRRLTEAGVLPVAQIYVEWPDAYEMTPVEHSTITSNRARAAQNLAKALTDQPNMLTSDDVKTIMNIGKTIDIIQPSNLAD